MTLVVGSSGWVFRGLEAGTRSRGVKRVSVSGTYGRGKRWETGEARSPSESFGAPVPVIKWGAGIMEATMMRYCARGNLYIPVVAGKEDSG